MPTYEYECKECAHNFEVFQAMSDEPIKICPQCGKEVRRLIFGGAGVIFKGSGFYVTDKGADKSKGKNTNSSPGKTARSETKADAGSSTVSDTPSSSAPTKAESAKADEAKGKSTPKTACA